MDFWACAHAWEEEEDSLFLQFWFCLHFHSYKMQGGYQMGSCVQPSQIEQTIYTGLRICLRLVQLHGTRMASMRRWCVGLTSELGQIASTHCLALLYINGVLLPQVFLPMSFITCYLFYGSSEHVILQAPQFKYPHVGNAFCCGNLMSACMCLLWSQKCILQSTVNDQ